MSEALTTTAWDEPEVKAFWLEEVRKRAESRLAEGISRKQALEFRDPEKAAQALCLLADGGMTQKAIREKLGLHGTELWRLARQHAGSLAAAFEHTRKDLAARYLNIAKRGAELMEKKFDRLEESDEQLDAVSIKDIALTIGIVHDKGMAAAGVATTVIEHRSGPSMEEFEQLREQARQRLAERSVAIEAEIITDGAEVAEA